MFFHTINPIILVKWAVETLKRLVVKSNASTDEEIFAMKEREKDRIKELKISHFGFNLDEFYKNFDQRVVSALSFGCELPEKYLMKLFADGCIEHQDLKARASLVHLEPERVESYSDLKIEYSNLIKPKTFRDERSEKGKQQALFKKGKEKGCLGKERDQVLQLWDRRTLCGQLQKTDYQMRTLQSYWS
jgi:hypothetical protein